LAKQRCHPRPERAAVGQASGYVATRRINPPQPRHCAANAWQQIKWRDGSNTPLRSRFARWRVRPARDDAKRCEPAPEEWLLIEWPEGETEPDHYWLATLPADISLERMVDQAKLRWRIERDYLELKQEVGLGHYEGRGWRGFHHHACLCVAAYGFLSPKRDDSPLRTGPHLARRAIHCRAWGAAKGAGGSKGRRKAAD
jgi:SRSO17 transposase